MWKNKTCSVRSNWCHRAGVKILIVWVSRRYIFVLCAVICSGGWNSNKSSALQLGHPSTRGPWDLRSRCKEEWPAYVSRGGNDLPRPILIFVAAKKNGFACRPSLPRGCIDSWFQAQTWESMQGFPRLCPPVLWVMPRESKLSTAWYPKRNQHRVCDADSLIIWVLRWVRDSNPRSDRSLTCFRGRLLQPLGQLTLDRQISYKFLKYQSCRGNAFNFSNLAIYFIQSLEELQFRKWWILINPKTFVS